MQLRNETTSTWSKSSIAMCLRLYIIMAAFSCNGPPTDIQAYEAGIFGRMACEKRFATKGGCGAHMFRVHGQVHPVRHLFDTTQCGCCLKEFHTFGRLKAHLIRADFCRHSLQRRGHFVHPSAGIDSATNQMQEHHHDGVLPPLQAQGPQLPAGHRAVRPDYDLELFEEIYEALLQAETEDEGLQQIRHIISNKAVTWEVVLTTLQALIDEATPGDTAVLTIGAPAYFAILRQLMCAERWPFLRSAEHVHAGHWHRNLETLEEYCLIGSGERSTLRACSDSSSRVWQDPIHPTHLFRMQKVR